SGTLAGPRSSSASAGGRSHCARRAGGEPVRRESSGIARPAGVSRVPNPTLPWAGEPLAGYRIARSLSCDSFEVMRVQVLKRLRSRRAKVGSGAALATLALVGSGLAVSSAPAASVEAPAPAPVMKQAV